MTDDVFIYFVKLPDGIDGVTLPCFGGYTIYIDERLTDHGRLKAYEHEMKHIKNRDFEKADVQEIEYYARR